MKHLRIKHVSASVLGALIALTLVVGGIGYYAPRQSVELLQNLALHDHPLANHLRQIERNSAELTQEHEELLASSSRSTRRSARWTR